VILAQVKTKKNDLYDPDKLRKDVQAIYGLGNFEDVSLEVTTFPRRHRDVQSGGKNR